MERAEQNKSHGRELIMEVNQALKQGKSVDANTYFEAITEAESGFADWPRDDVKGIFERGIGSNTPLDENNNPMREVTLKKKKRSADF